MAVKHPEYVLAGAAAVCLPMVPGILAGTISASTAGERFLLALVVCWILGSIVSWTVRNYGEQAQRAELMRMVRADEPEHATVGDDSTVAE